MSLAVNCEQAVGTDIVLKPCCCLVPGQQEGDDLVTPLHTPNRRLRPSANEDKSDSGKLLAEGAGDHGSLQYATVRIMLVHPLWPEPFGGRLAISRLGRAAPLLARIDLSTGIFRGTNISAEAVLHECEGFGWEEVPRRYPALAGERMRSLMAFRAWCFMVDVYVEQTDPVEVMVQRLEKVGWLLEDILGLEVEP
jgi:hypothetical protein